MNSSRCWHKLEESDAAGNVRMCVKRACLGKRCTGQRTLSATSYIPDAFVSLSTSSIIYVPINSFERACSLSCIPPTLEDNVEMISHRSTAHAHRGLTVHNGTFVIAPSDPYSRARTQGAPKPHSLGMHSRLHPLLLEKNATTCLLASI